MCWTQHHNRHQHITKQLITTHFLFLFFSLFPYFLVSYLGLIHSSLSYYSTFTFSAVQIAIHPLLHKTASFVQSNIRSLASSFDLPRPPTLISQYACPIVQRHAFEQDVPRSQGPSSSLHDPRHWHLLQLHPDDLHDWH
jgi:hypothetical protein